MLEELLKVMKRKIFQVLVEAAGEPSLMKHQLGKDF